MCKNQSHSTTFDRHGIRQLPGRECAARFGTANPPDKDTVRVMEDIGALRRFADQVRREAPKCPVCGRPETGPLPVVGGVARGTFRAGERYLNAGARPMSRAEAGLCSCWTVQLGPGVAPEPLRVPGHREACHNAIDTLLYALDLTQDGDALRKCFQDILHALQDHSPDDGVFYRRIESNAGQEPFTVRLAPVHREISNAIS